MEAFWWKNYHHFQRITLCDYFSHDYLLCNTTASTTTTTLKLPTIFNVMFIPSYIIIMSKLEKFQFIISFFFAFSPHFLLFEIRQLCPSFLPLRCSFHLFFALSFYSTQKVDQKQLCGDGQQIKQRFVLIHTAYSIKICIVESLNHTTTPKVSRPQKNSLNS